jgi:hypothetical protein
LKKTPVQKRRPAPRKPSPRPARPTPAPPARPSRARRESIKPEPPPAPAVEPPAPSGPEEISLSTPEIAFVTRPLPPEPERPLPARRRAIFFDVENTSRPEHLSRVLDHLAVDWSVWRTDLVAVGNWKVIGRDTARLLARRGAHLIHSAPSVGVSDWSDLRIGVAAGVWLARAQPGDVLEIITNDRAFDAVGDVAASLGIGFKRLTHQGLASAASEDEAPAPAASAVSDRQPRRHGRGRRRRRWGESTPVAPAAPREPVPQETAGPAPVATVEPMAETGGESAPSAHTAPHDEIINVIHDLMQRSPTRAVTIDTLANALKGRGFSRTPGSPRLITRLRRIKEISVSRSGVITLVGEAGAIAAPPTVPVPEARPEAPGEVESAVAGAPIEAESAPPAAPDGPASEASATPERARRRRRPWRGRHRRRPVAAPTA